MQDALEDSDLLGGSGTNGSDAVEQGVTRDFLLAAFLDLKEEILTTTSDLSGDLQEQHRKVAEPGSRVEIVKKGLHEQVDNCNKLQERLLVLELHLYQFQDKHEDLENRSRLNSVHIRGVPLELEHLGQDAPHWPTITLTIMGQEALLKMMPLLQLLYVMQNTSYKIPLEYFRKLDSQLGELLRDRAPRILPYAAGEAADRQALTQRKLLAKHSLLLSGFSRAHLEELSQR
ncbi:hypothetical protein NDU88_003646 [Pleurodeles waltl]|uniref:Uncharacterized protein n=1 Tax=Pleurodeles waltl TaxID=8319 RepID=A0AAV7PCS8_PLEWA|nr:hypothetical protein NDU88_003646 [Pleurodeles waltl]